MLRLLLPLLLIATAAQARPELVDGIRDDLLLRRSVRFKPGVYTVADLAGDGVLKVGADNITIDLAGVTLRGLAEGAGLDRAAGIGLDLRGHEGVVIKNARIHGYRINIRLEKARRAAIIDCDASFARAEKICDGAKLRNVWLALRDPARWRAYGAGIWVEDSAEVAVRGCRVGGTQNGVVFFKTRSSTITRCDVSFNSGWGLALWRSCDNQIRWNAADFVGRPWAGSVGADSAAIAVVNESHRNRFIGNSLTHSGDGFFLTNATDLAGGDFKGPCDNNIVALNDGSYSPHNAFEATFSNNNLFVGNLADRSRYGFWLGFSNNSLLLDNSIDGNRAVAIAIPNGAGNLIVDNSLRANLAGAIQLFSPPKWKARFPCQRTLIQGNRFEGSRPLTLSHADQVRFVDNRLEGPAPTLPGPAPDGLAFDAAIFWRSPAGQEIRAAEKELEEEHPGLLYSENPRWPRGLIWYAFNDYAPRDFRAEPCVFAVDERGRTRVWILGDGARPASKQVGFRLEATDSPRQFFVRADDEKEGPSRRRDLSLTLRSAAGSRQVPFALDSVQWAVRYFERPPLKIDDAAAWERLFAGPPTATRRQDRLSDRWLDKEPSGGRWALEAKADYLFKKGTYRFTCLSDDGVRIQVGGRTIIERWTHHAAESDEARVALDGPAEVRVRYFQHGGGSALQVRWERE